MCSCVRFISLFTTRVPISLVAYAQIGWRTERHTNSNIYESISGELYNHHFIRRKHSNVAHAGLWSRRRRIVHYPILKPPPFVFNEQIGGFCKYWIRFGPNFFWHKCINRLFIYRKLCFSGVTWALCHLFVAVPLPFSFVLYNIFLIFQSHYYQSLCSPTSYNFPDSFC